MKKPNVASFFAGIGGFDIGFEQAGFNINFQCEINDFCKSVLKHHWPDVASTSDITSIDAKDIPNAEIWCGGFPCQDLSVARGSNGRHGLSGKRSGLFFKLAELAKVKKPKVILIENVHGLLNSNNGRDFAELLHILDGLDYAVSWRLLNSRYFGVPQSRPRVYICAWLKNPAAAGNSLFESRAIPNIKNERTGFLTTSWCGGSGPIPPKLAFCLAATSGRHTGTDWSRTYIPYSNEVRRLTPLECERLQGFPDNWTKLHLSHVNVEKADGLRYHALGNAVSVAVVHWVADRIFSQLNKPSDSKFDAVKFCLSNWPSLVNGCENPRSLKILRSGESKIAWPTAGLLWKDQIITNNCSPTPFQPIESDLMDLIEPKKPHARYFISPNAAEGILRRVDSQNRHLFPHLRDALEHLSGRTSELKAAS